MKIMSFNTQFCTNFVTQKIDFEIMADAIRKCDADIVGLNEMYDKSHMEEFDSQTRKLADLTGMKYYKFAEACTLEEGTFGNGFLSRVPITDCSVIHIPEKDVDKSVMFYEMRCILKAKLANGFNVLVTHFGLSEKEHINAVEAIMENLEEEKCVLMGDFNVTPDNKVLSPIKEKMKDTADLFEENLMSFPSDKPCKKIDYIFVSKDIEVISADIPEIISADHRPHTAEIKIQ
ncbi:MAG: hypothetical protein E7555_06870 [Ruminococcaceae bacterium]|nr:hypothetical protein [Oscillospiraceae bacterium]